MAKKKKSSGFRYRTKTVVKRVKSYASDLTKPIQPDAMAYGAVRQPLSAWMLKTLGNVPIVGGIAGRYADNVLMGVASYFAAKKGKGFIKQMGIKGLVAENVLVGADLGQQIMPSLGMTTGTSSSSGYPV